MIRSSEFKRSPHAGVSWETEEGSKKTVNVHFMSQTVEWATPKGVYDALDKEFGFTFDPCPLDGGADGTATLFSDWRGQRVFCNPPYGPELRPFLERWSDADLAVYLIPARTDTRWFHEVVLPHASEIRFVKGRLKFGDAKNSAPFPSMLAIFKSTAVPACNETEPEE